MTKEEKIIVSAYTGVLMTQFNDVHEYIQQILGRPVWSHELASERIWDEIREKTKDDFIKICKNTFVKSEPLEPIENGLMNVTTGKPYIYCPSCGADINRMIYIDHYPHYCCECGQALKPPKGKM